MGLPRVIFSDIFLDVVVFDNSIILMHLIFSFFYFLWFLA